MDDSTSPEQMVIGLAFTRGRSPITVAGNREVRCGFPTVADMESDVGATRGPCFTMVSATSSRARRAGITPSPAARFALSAGATLKRCLRRLSSSSVRSFPAPTPWRRCRRVCSLCFRRDRRLPPGGTLGG